MIWPRFLRTVLTTFATVVMLVYALILLVDPYQNVPFSLPLDRAPISTNQRFAYPALARDPGFDSVVIGSSTVRLLDPDELDRLTGARFANLAMNSATAYEQTRIHDLFLRAHPDAKHVLIGIDDSWCKRGAGYDKFTFRAFPPWMYDDNRWNDLLYLFNDKALENTVRMLEFVFGRRQAKYKTNGYRDFTTDFGTYDIERVRKRIYPHGIPAVRRVPDIAPVVEHSTWEFGAHVLLEQMLTVGAGQGETMLVFVPMHGDYLARGEALYRDCKARIVEIGQRHGANMIDFMLESEITKNDENYWDPLHFRSAVARQVERGIANRLAGRPAQRQLYVTY